MAMWSCLEEMMVLRVKVCLVSATRHVHGFIYFYFILFLFSVGQFFPAQRKHTRQQTAIPKQRNLVFPLRAFTITLSAHSKANEKDCKDIKCPKKQSVYG